MKSNFPTVPIYDVKFQKESHDLLVATHGRGLFVMDDISPLEEYNETQLASAEMKLFPVQAATNWLQWNRGGFSQASFHRAQSTERSGDQLLAEERCAGTLAARPEQARQQQLADAVDVAARAVVVAHLADSVAALRAGRCALRLPTRLERRSVLSRDPAKLASIARFGT